MLNSLSDPFLVNDYHEEYLRLINRYQNFKHPSSFVRYYNINYQESVKHETVESTFDIYSISDIKFNIYELTPTYNISPIISSTTNLTDKKGVMFDGVSSISIFTIKTPRVNDIITFYDPIKAGEIFRVTNMRTSINAYYSNPQLTWYEMDLEIAPIKDTSKLKISNHYIYDLHKEEYLNYKEYKIKNDLIQQINSKIEEIRNAFYSPYYDLYKSQNLVPIITNQSICLFKQRISNSVRLFNDLPKPYGFIDIFPQLPETLDFTRPQQVYDLASQTVVDYPLGNADLDNLLNLSRDLYNLFSENQNYF